MIIFRADGNNSIGSGHVMRCLSIADAAKRAGERCVFVTSGEEFLSVIFSHGHECIVLNTKYTDMNAELNSFLPIIYKCNPSMLFVDSYFVTDFYLQRLWESMKKCNGKLVYIDDVLAFPYPCDALINYNIFGPDKKEEYHSLYGKEKIPTPKLFLGTLYAPLREEFQNLPDRIIKRQAQNILISTGGADFEHLTIELIKEVKKCRSLYTFHFIIGAVNQDKEMIHEISGDVPHIILYDNVTQMAKLMSCCDLAISAAGSTLYELCATQTPTITYILADNQIPGAEGFSKHHILESAGDIRDLGSANLSRLLVERAVGLANDYERRIRISSRMKTVVDGNGADNLLCALRKMLDDQIENFYY